MSRTKAVVMGVGSADGLGAAREFMSGRELLDAMLRGELPLPPIFHPEGSASGAAIRERNQ
jgi:hypothetical protein